MHFAWVQGQTVAAGVALLMYLMDKLHVIDSAVETADEESAIRICDHVTQLWLSLPTARLLFCGFTDKLSDYPYRCLRKLSLWENPWKTFIAWVHTYGSHSFGKCWLFLALLPVNVSICFPCNFPCDTRRTVCFGVVYNCKVLHVHCIHYRQLALDWYLLKKQTLELWINQVTRWIKFLLLAMLLT